MFKKTWLLLTTLLIIFLIGLGVRAAGNNYVYHSTTGEVAVSLKEKILVREDEIIDIILSDSGEETETVLDPDRATKRWHLHNGEEDTSVMAKRVYPFPSRH